MEKYCTSFLIKAGKETFLFETGPGIVGQLLKLHISCSQIDSVFISHAHFDHFLDFPYLFLRSLETYKGLSMQPLQLISTSQVFKLTSYLFENCYEGIPLSKLVKFLEASTFEFSSFRVGSFSVITAPVKHTLPTIGCRIEINGKILAYSGDTIYTQNLVKLAKGADILICEAMASSSNPPLQQIAKALLHGTAYEAGKMAEEAKVKKLILIHADPSERKEELIADAGKSFRGEIHVPGEFEKIII
jgi:ribonuclease BN (tRNA processing enzyme)